MSSQLKLEFSQNTIHNINLYREAGKTESVGGGSINVQFTTTQKEALLSIMKEHNIKASTFIREMVDTYLEIFPYRHKISQHKDFLIQLLNKLP